MLDRKHSAWLAFLAPEGESQRPHSVQAISLVFGKRAVVQRCQIHKMRNVVGHLPKELQPSVRQTMREAYASKTHKTALA
ncbi:MAG: hypothetical protein GY811_22025 [Myxococcales bacterium]|nr:hypothetical protein [Myxococcales bacterium]